MRLLLVGQAPARSMTPGAPALLGTSTWSRLAAYAGTTSDALALRCQTTNVWPDYPGKGLNGKHDRQPSLRDAAPHVAHLWRVLEELLTSGHPYAPTHVACLGQWTTKAMIGSLEGTVDYCATIYRGLFPVTKLYHPGGTNMHLNDPVRRSRLSDTIRLLVRDSSVLLTDSSEYRVVWEHLEDRGGVRAEVVREA